MSIRDALERVADAVSQREIDLSPFNVIRDEDLDSGLTTATGKRISPDKAIEGVGAVYACVSFLGETVGSLPCHLHRRTSDRERPTVQESKGRWPGSLARTLHQSPNPEMSAAEFWELAETHVDLWGNFYADIERDGAGRPSNLWPLRPDRMTVSWGPNKQRRYTYYLPSGEPRVLARRDVFHVRGFGHDPLMGIPPIGVARQGLGILVSAEEYGGRFFSNSAIPGGVLQTANPAPTDEKKRREWVKGVRKSWQDSVGGLKRSHRIAVLHSGLTYQAIGIPPKDSQFIETRRWQLGEVARIYRIPPHLVGDTERSTSWGTGIEQQTIGFVVYTLRPRLTRLEGAINRDLRDPEGGNTLLDENLFAKFSINGLLRGDMQARGEFYGKGILSGWLTREDVRALEDLPLVPGLEKPTLPANFDVLDEEGNPPPDRPSQSRREELDQAYQEHLAALNGDPTKTG